MNKSPSSNDPIRVISPSLVLVDWGPMTLSVSAWLEGEPRPVMAALGAREALGCLAELSDFHKYLKQKVEGLKIKPSLPRVVARCVEACQAVSGDLTGLAAVAGAAADQVLAALLEQGADQAIVNNGGDIALRAAQGNPLRVGLRPHGVVSGRPPELDAVLKVSRRSGIGGVASSGWQGRSHSPGVADLVTPWARSAALADAAATWIAGRCLVEAPGIERTPARELDPDSDLGDMPVTRSVPPLSREDKQTALAGGLAAAQKLVRAGSILGCRIDVQGSIGLIDRMGACPPDPNPDRRDIDALNPVCGRQS